MSLTTRSLPSMPGLPLAAVAPSRTLYFALLDPDQDARDRADAADYLEHQLNAARRLPCPLPDDPEALPGWIEHNTEQVGRQYQAYLDGRKAGTARRYFPSKSYALHFLQGVAPTKLVDGAWLYGLLRHWQDPRFTALIQTYLEELGEGRAEKNHVVLYRKLLASQGCQDGQALDDTHFVQGAIQLALAEQAERFLPELIGFNLGYEQLPLHLLISAYELRELGIDPYYFTLHVTVDNAASGHAQKAVQAVRAAWPQLGDRSDFYRRIADGYRLNELGASTLSVIAGFDLQQQVREIFERKSRVGRFVHSDYCRFAGRTVNQWLADPAQVPAFLATLVQRGWIKHHQDPRHSRFWQLLQGEQAPMFGVFSAQEQQAIYDWIAGDWSDQAPPASTRRWQHPRHDARPLPQEPRHNDVDHEQRLLEQQLLAQPDHAARMRLLIPLLAPHRHHTAAGLLATRHFSRLFNH